MTRRSWCLVLLALQATATWAQEARSLTIQVWSARSLQSLRVVPLSDEKSGGQAPFEVDWSQAGLRVSASKIVQQLLLRGNYRLEAEGAPLSAAGQWIIGWQSTGLRVTLTLPSERYVAAALNGEAAMDEPAASLKAMAISIRTFALVNAGRHRGQGFDLCDSTHCQALSFDRPRPEVERAVQETAGETLWFGGRRAHVYYTQHCGGDSEAAAEVWPVEGASYLGRRHADPYCMRRSRAEWHARIPLIEMERIFGAQAWRTPSPITAITITRKSAGGRAKLLTISGHGAPAAVSASSLRFAVNRTLGWNQIRSDWYSARVTGPTLVIDGQGYGHGVGLCQTGAYEMAAEGHSDRDILSFYFPGTAVGITTADHGWHEVAGAGWTLLTTRTAGDLLAQGNTAWAKAQALLGETSVGKAPMVQEFPSTELFRQTANQPGWMLASTRGRVVWLQPATVRQNNGGTEALLLHEFLHVLIEQRAGTEAPLWLREGLVEALAGKGKADSPDQSRGEPGAESASEIDAALAQPGDASAARRAHRAAAAMAQQMLDRYGLPAVKEFLRHGLPATAAQSL